MSRELSIIKEKLEGCEKTLKEIRAYLRMTSPSGKLTTSFNGLKLEGSEHAIIYTEDALHDAYDDFLEILERVGADPDQKPTVEEFRISYEEELMEEYGDDKTGFSRLDGRQLDEDDGSDKNYH